MGSPGVYQIPDRIASGLFFVYDSSQVEYLIRLRGKADPTNWEPGTFNVKHSNFSNELFPCWWGSGHPSVTRMLDACSQHADSGWLVSEESLHLINVLDKNVDDIGIPKPSWWVHIPSEYRIPIPPVCEHFRASLRRDPEDPLWAIAFADHIVMIAVTVVYQALVRQRFISWSLPCARWFGPFPLFGL